MLIVVACVFFVFLLQVIAPRLLPSIARTVAIPFWKTESFVVTKFDRFFGYFRTKGSLMSENNLFRLELEDAHNRLLALEILEKENIELKEMIGRKLERTELSTFVLARPPRTVYDTFVLDVGKNGNVKAGDKVLVSGTIWLGEIRETYGDSSLAKLLSSPGEKRELLVARTNTPVTIVGAGNGNFRAEIPRGVSVNIGDVLVPPGLKEMVVAKIYDIELNPEDSFQKIYARAPINIQTLISVDVDINNVLKIDDKILQATSKATTSKNTKK